MFEVVEENKNVKTVKVSLDHKAIDEARDEVYEDISKDIKVKGFRPGMVPRNLINTIIGMDRINSLIKDQVADEAFHMLMRDYFKDINEIDTVLPPKVKSVELGGTADILFEIHAFPKAEIESMKGIEITIPDFGSADEEVSRTIEELREEKAILTPKAVDQSAQIGDVAEIEYVDLNGKDPEKKTLEIRIGEPEEGTIFPHIIGKKVGDEFDFTSTAENTGNKASLHVKLTKLYLKQLPDLDDNFAKMVDEKYETFDDLKATLKDDFNKSLDEVIVSIKRDRILNELVNKTKIDVLDSTIDYFMNYLVDQKKEDKVYDKELKDKFHGDEKAYMNSIRDEVISYLKLEGALKFVAQEKSLSVSDEEIFEEAKRDYEESKISDERLKIMLKKDPALYSMIRRELLSSKVADELLKDAVVTVEKDDEDELIEDDEENDESEGEN